MPSSILDKSFKTTIIVKGIDGVLQVLGAALLYFLKPGTINHTVAVLTQRELAEDPGDWIALHLLSVTQRLGDVKTFAAVYLCVHGLLKIILASSLLEGALWAYPTMIGYLLVFIGYQLYRYSVSRAVGWLLLAVFDAGIVWLTWWEYQEHRQLSGHMLQR